MLLRPSSAACLQADLRDIETLPWLVTGTIDRFGRLDALVNNASSFFPTPFGSIDQAAWDESARQQSQGAAVSDPGGRAAPGWPPRGAVVNITDIHAERPLAGYPLYCAAKAGLLGLTRALAIELAPLVRVNAVAPGPILWPEECSFDSAARAEIVAHTLLQRAGCPQDIARGTLPARGRGLRDRPGHQRRWRPYRASVVLSRHQRGFLGTVNTPCCASESALRGKVGKAIADYHMIAHGDTVLVCLSGGKDSYTLLSILMALRERAPVNFRLIAMNLDQKQPGFPADVLPNYLAAIGVEYRIVEQDTYSVVKSKIPEGKTTCSLCSRLRRGIIYRTAKEVGANKIALGHHRDDIVHTLFLNLFFGGQLKAMPPKLVTDDGAHVVIRPLAYCSEADIARFARGMEYPIIPCNLCGSQDNLQRQRIREMMADWDRRYPGRTLSVFSALQKVDSLASGRPCPCSTSRACVPGADLTAMAGGDTVFDPQPPGDRCSSPEIIPLQVVRR
jgi:tRNA 2-thiocytidine biosynthesis protein TtcA